MGPRSSVQYRMTQINEQSIREAVKLHEQARDKMMNLFNRYMFKNIAIQTRKVEDISKPNNKLVNDFRSYIVDQSVGYLFGNEVDYTIDKASYEGNEALYDKFSDLLEDFITANEMGDLDAEIATYMGVSGYAARLYYIDSENDNQIMSMNLPGWEVFFVYDGLKRTHAIRYQYYNTPYKENALAVTVYTDKQLIRYEEDKDGKFIALAEKEHGFSYIPVALFQNNSEEMGDFEKVEPLIDAYDIVVSDAVNEVEAFAHAYMLFKGMRIDEQTMKAFKRTGGIEVDENGDVKFITKEINDSFLENTKKTLVTNIHKFSGSVDMADENFSGGAQSGESRKWKLLGLETKAGKKQRKFAKGLREQFRIICSSWKLSAPEINHKYVSFKLGRNIPQDLVYIADFASKINGIISKETLFGNLDGVVDDSQYELELLKQEQEDFAATLTAPNYQLPADKNIEEQRSTQ